MQVNHTPPLCIYDKVLEELPVHFLCFLGVFGNSLSYFLLISPAVQKLDKTPPTNSWLHFIKKLSEKCPTQTLRNNFHCATIVLQPAAIVV